MDARSRPARMYGGVDVGGTKTAAVIMDGDGRVRGSARVPTVPGERGVVSSIADAVRLAARDLGEAPVELRAVGVGVPGAVEVATGTVASAVNVGLDGVRLGDAVAGAVDAPVHVDNDVNLAALGLARADAAGSLAYVNLGTGFGVGVVVDGVLLRGRSGAAGEIGHLPFDPAGARCPCGQRGCIELAASGGALARAAGVRPVAQLFRDAAAAGDADDAAAVERFCAALALGVRIVVQAYDVETVALGGGVFASAAEFMPRVREILGTAEAESPFVGGLRLVDRLRLVDSAVPHAARGAAWWAMSEDRPGAG